jgi:ribA/ribD-fused uncharacterized protein
MKKQNDMYLFWRTDDVFSNWNLTGFVVQNLDLVAEGRHIVIRDAAFNCSEQYMMYVKALFFGDIASAKAILAESSPRKQKALGRTVQGYVDAEWLKNCRSLMTPGLLAKFAQNLSAGRVLLGTGDALIVEASPYDCVWGVGLEAGDPRILDQATWRGTNYLGFTLMATRDQLRTQQPQTLF